MTTAKKFDPNKVFEVIFQDDKQRLVKYPPLVDGNVVYELQRTMGKDLYHVEKRIEVSTNSTSGVWFTPGLLQVIINDHTASSH